MKLNHLASKTGKHFLGIATFYFAFIAIVSAQSNVSFEATQIFANAKYVSNGKVDPNYQVIGTNGFTLAFDHVFVKGFVVGGAIGMQNMGTQYVDKGVNSIGNVTYNFQYINFRGYVGYEFNKYRLMPFAYFSPYYAYLLKSSTFSTISINSTGNIGDPKGENTVINSDYGFMVNLGVRIELSDYITVFGSGSYAIGLENISNLSDRQAYNRGLIFGLGVSATITKKPAQWIQF